MVGLHGNGLISNAYSKMPCYSLDDEYLDMQFPTVPERKKKSQATPFQFDLLDLSRGPDHQWG